MGPGLVLQVCVCVFRLSAEPYPYPLSKFCHGKNRDERKKETEDGDYYAKGKENER